MRREGGLYLFILGYSSSRRFLHQINKAAIHFGILPPVPHSRLCRARSHFISHSPPRLALGEGPERGCALSVSKEQTLCFRSWPARAGCSPSVVWGSGAGRGGSWKENSGSGLLFLLAPGPRSSVRCGPATPQQQGLLYLRPCTGPQASGLPPGAASANTRLCSVPPLSLCPMNHGNAQHARQVCRQQLQMRESPRPTQHEPTPSQKEVPPRGLQGSQDPTEPTLKTTSCVHRGLETLAGIHMAISSFRK